MKEDVSKSLVKRIQFLYIALAIGSWITFTALDLFSVYGILHNSSWYIPEWLSNIFLCAFCFCIFLYFKISVGKNRSSNFIEYLWRVFIFGSLTILLFLLVKFIFFLFEYRKFHDPYFINLFYHDQIEKNT